MIFWPGGVYTVGLGLAVRINIQYSDPVCMGRRTDTYTAINDTQEISQNIAYLLGNVHAGIWELQEQDTVWTMCR